MTYWVSNGSWGLQEQHTFLSVDFLRFISGGVDDGKRLLYSFLSYATHFWHFNRLHTALPTHTRTSSGLPSSQTRRTNYPQIAKSLNRVPGRPDNPSQYAIMMCQTNTCMGSDHVTLHKSCADSQSKHVTDAPLSLYATSVNNLLQENQQDGFLLQRV